MNVHSRSWRDGVGLAFRLLLPLLLASAGAPARGALYSVGIGKMFAEVHEVPWEKLDPGDRVEIHWRPAPYAAKWVLGRRGTEAKPIRVVGMPGPAGQLPVIEGRGAKTRPELDYWHGPRSVIKIGGANRPADVVPAWISIEHLEVRGARPPYTYQGVGGPEHYAANAAAIFVEKGEHITIRHCTLRDCALGLGVSAPAREIMVEYCHFYDNGVEGSVYQHNSYTSAAGMIYQYNRFGPLRAGCRGNNVKDRSAGLVVRGNWVAGGNRQLDLVDAEDLAALRLDPRYRQTFVYGNVLIKLAGAGSHQMVHYGGDSGHSDWYRKGVLYFYHNTLVSERSDSTVLFEVATNEERIDCRNNIVHITGAGGRLVLLGGLGRVDLTSNWLPSGWTKTLSRRAGTVLLQGFNPSGSSPGFRNERAWDLHLAPGSSCIGAGAALPLDVLRGHPLTTQYELHQASKPRLGDGTHPERPLDLGAFEFEKRLE